MAQRTLETQQADETIFYELDSSSTQQEDNNSIDSQSTEVAELTNNQSPEAEPRKLVSPVVQRMADLHERALDKFKKEYKCGIKIGTWATLKNSKAKKVEKINEWIRVHHPHWEKDAEGFYLVKHNALMLEKKCYLSNFTMIEMKVLAKHMGIEIDITEKTKAEIIEEITKKAKKKYPFMKTTPGGNLVIDPAHFT